MDIVSTLSTMLWVYILLIILVIALCIVIRIYLSLCLYEIANEKGFDEKRYFWIPFLFGMPGYLMVIALPDRGAEYQINPVIPSPPSKDN